MRCSECKFLESDEGFGGTEVTGSTPPIIRCRKYHWEFDFSEARQSLRDAERIGAACKDFEALER